MMRQALPTHRTAVLHALTTDRCMPVEALAAATGLDPHEAVKAAGDLIQAGHATRAEAGCFTLTPEGAVARSRPRETAERSRLDDARRASRAAAKPKPAPKAAKSPAPRRADSLTSRVWAAFRIKGKATMAELVAMARAEGERESSVYAFVRNYMAGLVQAGFAVALPHRGRNNAKRFSLIRNSGPAAPMLRRAQTPPQLYDPNTGETHALERAGGGAR